MLTDLYSKGELKHQERNLLILQLESWDKVGCRPISKWHFWSMPSSVQIWAIRGQNWKTSARAGCSRAGLQLDTLGGVTRPSLPMAESHSTMGKYRWLSINLVLKWKQCWGVVQTCAAMVHTCTSWFGALVRGIRATFSWVAVGWSYVYATIVLMQDNRCYLLAKVSQQSARSVIEHWDPWTFPAKLLLVSPCTQLSLWVFTARSFAVQLPFIYWCPVILP